ncbi:unnamed protein product [Sphagnum balticum]
MPQQSHHPHHQRGGARNGGSGAQLVVDERLQQLVLRMRSALQLGFRSSSSLERGDGRWKDGGQKWYTTDAQVQGQAVRAIAAFVAALPPQPFPVSLLQAAIDEAVPALETLLAAEQDAVYKQAAVATSGLVGVLREHHLLQLLLPLAGLLSPSKAAVATASAATAMLRIIGTAKPRVADKWRGLDDPVWQALEQADVLGSILSQLDMGQSVHGTTGVAECNEVLAMILERWPVARFRVGHMQSVRIALLSHGMSSDKAITIAGLRACSALVLCAGVATLYLQIGQDLWATIAHCLQTFKSPWVRVEALRLLSLLARVSSFSASCRGLHLQAIVEGCLRALEEAREARSSAEVKWVALEAAHATSVMLRWPGDHHEVFHNMGVAQIISDLLLERDALTSMKNSAEPSAKLRHNRRPRGTGKGNLMLWPLLWESLGFIAAHYKSPLEKGPLSGKSFHEDILCGLPATACQVNEEAGLIMDEEQMTGQELLQLCRAVFLLLSSPSQGLSACSRLCLKTALELHGNDWLPLLVDSLALGHLAPSLVRPDNLQTAMNLFALASFAWLPACQELLLQGNVLEVVMAVICIHAPSAIATKQERLSSAKWSVSHARVGIAAKTCCQEITEDWEGDDAVLFASLCAFAKLASGSKWVNALTVSLKQGRLDDDSLHSRIHGELVSILWQLAEGRTVSPGVRWWAVCGLACFGVYGFPSTLGRDLYQAFDNSSLADIVFVLADGSRLHAHALILAIRCPSLLPNQSPSSNNTTTERFVCHDVHLSDHVSYEAVRALLEFAYTGLVQIHSTEINNVRVLAKRCGLLPLISLLHNRAPVWGLAPASCDLASALGSVGHHFGDIILQGKTDARGIEDSLNPCQGRKACEQIGDHVHVHRVVLSARCEYFQALFRSGMRDSMVGTVHTTLSRESSKALMYFLYTGKLNRLTEAEATCEQWDIVEMCACIIAPHYTYLRDTGAFDQLNDGLKDLLRTSHVQFALADVHLQPA